MSWIALAWTALFLLGACVSAWNLYECWKDYAASRTTQWVGTEVEGAAVYEFWSEAVRLAELVGGFLAGALALSHVFVYSVLWFLFVIPIGLCINTIRAARFRVSYGHAHRLRRTRGGDHK